jgi:hypothetical protein
MVSDLKVPIGLLICQTFFLYSITGPVIAICLDHSLNLKEIVIFFNYLFSRDGVGSETVFLL